MHIFNCEAHDISEDIYLQKLPQSFFVNLRFLFTFDNQIQLSKQRGTYFESAENTGLYLTILEPDTLTTVRLSSPMLLSCGGCHYLTCALYHKILNSKLNLYIWSGMIFINISLRMLHTKKIGDIWDIKYNKYGVN